MILRLPQVTETTGLPRATIYRLIAREVDPFPAQPSNWLRIR